MRSSCVHPSMKFGATAVVRMLAASLALTVIFALSSTAAYAQCTLNGSANACLLIGPVTITTTYDAGEVTWVDGGMLSGERSHYQQRHRNVHVRSQ